MKNIVKLHILLLITSFVFLACNKSETGKITDYSKCKYNDKASFQGDDYGSDTTCVTYTLEEADKTLKLKHINSSFNCCPGKLNADISISNDTIYIRESSSKEECSCMCLFDLEFEVYDIKKQTYHIEIIEPYIGSQEKISFDIDLASQNSGEFCLGRDQYPWGI